MKDMKFYQDYADRLAALIEGPLGYGLGEERRNEAIIDLIRILPENPPERVSGFPNRFSTDAFDREKMSRTFRGLDQLNCLESLEDQAENHWEMRNDQSLQNLE